MTDIPAVRAQLEKAKREEEIIRLAAEQVVRDFERFGLEVVFSGKATEAYDELSWQLKQHIELLLKSQSGKLGALLYQIDVNQKKASRIFGLLDASEELTEMILEREFIKVLTRIYFKKILLPSEKRFCSNDIKENYLIRVHTRSSFQMVIIFSYWNYFQ